MTCEDVLAVEGIGTDALTPSFLIAMVRHMAECPKCKAMLVEASMEADLDASEKVKTDALVAHWMPICLEHAAMDPEILPESPK